MTAMVRALARLAACALVAGCAAAGGAAWFAEPALGDAIPRLPGPAPRARADGLAAVTKKNAECESCHTDIAKEWRASLHRQAWRDPVFQKAYAIEPVAFCRGCHAPEADASAEPPKEAQDLGVGCVTCHVQDGAVVGSRALSKTDQHHAVVGDARLSSTDACAACHQFDFPRTPGMAMQDTLAEHRASKLAGQSCQSCHMPTVTTASGASHRSHDFSVMTNPQMIRSAASVKAERGGARAIEITITAANVGHAFPTGDMFRRLEVRAEAVDKNGKVVARATPVHLARTFGDRGLSPTTAELRRVEVADTRVPAPGAGGGRVAELVFDAPVEDSEVRWVVAYQRMDHAMAASFGVEQAHDEIVVASGVLQRER